MKQDLVALWTHPHQTTISKLIMGLQTASSCFLHHLSILRQSPASCSWAAASPLTGSALTPWIDTAGQHWRHRLPTAAEDSRTSVTRNQTITHVSCLYHRPAGHPQRHHAQRLWAAPPKTRLLILLVRRGHQHRPSVGLAMRFRPCLSLLDHGGPSLQTAGKKGDSNAARASLSHASF